MKKILLILVMLSTGYAFSQSMPPTFPVEMKHSAFYPFFEIRAPLPK